MKKHDPVKPGVGDNMSEKTKTRKRRSLIMQVGMIFAVSIVLTGAITYVTQFYGSMNTVTLDTEKHGKSIASEVMLGITDYPAYRWLLSYWCDHADELDIEYDADFGEGTVTEEKSRLLREHQPDFQIDYAKTEDVEALPEEDQKLYAEIVYSWLITHLDQIKSFHSAKFLYCVRTKEPFDTQTFVLSAADPGSVRGTEGDQIYTLGFEIPFSDNQREAVRHALKDDPYLATTADYVSFYYHLDTIDGYDYLIGLTYDQRGILSDITSRTMRGAMLSMLYILLLSVLVSVGIMMLVLRPLSKVSRAIQTYSDTKDSAAVAEALSTVKSNNEIGELASEFIVFTREMDDYLEKNRSITAEKERIETELSLASRIQYSMLPHDFPPFPDRNEFDIYASMDPARAVGGDFYDFFLIDDDHLCLVMADVSGKGIPGALFMMVSKIILQSCAMLGRSASEILEKTNEALCSNNKAEMFVTVWIGILEISTGMIRAANAGHEYPAVRHGSGSFELLKDKHGFVIGGMDGVRYTEYELKMEPGDKIFLYTDGVPEATDADECLFGTDRMLDALNSDPAAGPEQILRNVRSSVDAFVKEAEQFDDLTMLCMEYRGQSPDQEG